MKACPIRRRFSCGSTTPSSAARNRSSASTTCRSVLKWFVNSSITDACLALPQQSVIDQDAGKLRADRLGTARPPRPSESTPPESPQITRSLAHPLANRSRSLRGRNRRSSTCREQLADRLQEVAQDLSSLRRVRHLGMELQAIDRQPSVLDRRDRAGIGRGQRLEIVGDAASPGRRGSSRLRSLGHAGEKLVVADVSRQWARPYSRAGALSHRAAQSLARQLHAVADAQHRQCRGRKISGSHCGAPVS